MRRPHHSTTAAPSPAAAHPPFPSPASDPAWWAVALLPLVSLLGLAALHVLSWPTYEAAVREDGPVEWLTVLVYVAAAGVGLALARGLWARGLRVPALLHLLLALGLLFVGGEEASWGQRQIGFTGPESLVERNLQAEANLHNLLGHASLHLVYIAVGLYGGLAWRFVHRIPVLRDRPALYAPPPVLALYFLLVALYYIGWFLSVPQAQVFGVTLDVERVYRSQEFPELLLSVGFLLFLVHVLRRVRRSGPRGPATDGAPG